MENTMKTETAPTVHKFERAGLGKAPFRYIGELKQDIAYGEAVMARDASGILVTTKPGGSCDYCGTYILNMFQIESADGKIFKVGSDCVAKTGDAGLVKKVNKIVAEKTKARKAARDAAKITDGKSFLFSDEVQAFAASQRSWSEYRANAHGDTLANYIEFVWKGAGTSGKLRLIFQVRKAFEASKV